MKQFNELDEYLISLDREPYYRVAKVLKKSATEETQLVYYPSSNGEVGPYIRKYISNPQEGTSVYETLYKAQHTGVRFHHVPTIFECFRKDDALVVVMAHIDGPTLEQLVAQEADRGMLSLNLFPRICDAVTELHKTLPQPIIHRDLKPSNIVISRDEAVPIMHGVARKDGSNRTVTLIDLGIAREYRQGAKSDTILVGTREYAPPEQFGYGQTDERTDVYALGMVLYFMLTGENPRLTIQQESRPAAITKHEWSVILQATRLMPNERQQNVQQLKSEAFDALNRRTSFWHKLFG